MSRQIPLLGIVPEKPDPNDNKFHVAIKTADGAVVSEALLDENFQPIPSGGGGETVEKIPVLLKFAYYKTENTSDFTQIKVNNDVLKFSNYLGTQQGGEAISFDGFITKNMYLTRNDKITLTAIGALVNCGISIRTWKNGSTSVTQKTISLNHGYPEEEIIDLSSSAYDDCLYICIEVEDTPDFGYHPRYLLSIEGDTLLGRSGARVAGYGDSYLQVYGVDDNVGDVGDDSVYIFGDDGIKMVGNNIHMYTPYGSIYHNGVVVSTGSGCLVKGTMITMADGSKKAIEDVHSGDEVLSYDFEHQTTVPAVVLFNTEHEATVYSRKQLFSDGSTLETVGEHYVYNVNGSACSDIQAWDTGDAAQKADGSVVNYCGYISCASEMTRNWNLITSNNTYYANDILNTCWPGTKFKMLAARGIKMPTELYEAVKQEFDYHRNGTTKANNPEFIAAVKEAEQQCSTLAKTISKNKKILDKTDYQMVKTSEQINDAILDSKDFDDFKSKVAAIYSKEFTKKVDERKAARDAIVAVEEQSAQLYDQVRQIKRQFGVWSEFEDMTTREQFMVCNKLGCENLERYRAWDFVTKAKEIFAPKEEVKEEEPKEETKSTRKKK